MSSSGLSPVKQALVALEEMRVKVEGLERSRTEPIAIVGMACRVPGAPDAERFWTLLKDGRDAVGEVPKSRWDTAAIYDVDPDKPGKIATRWGGFLDCIDEFEPEFFGISPREALAMDPQQRLLLEVAWEALENAGQSPAHLAASPTGVFIGITGDEFAQMFHKAGDVNRFDMYFASGVARSVAAGRISYVLGLHGPSLSIDTACSSSLVAVHSACLHLRAGECRTALAGGVNIILSPEITMAFSRAHMMARDGRCKTFDASADGFVRAEGCGIVILKRLSDALADGDNILAVIRGSAVNQDGRSSGLTAPNGPAQESVIRQALANARVQPADVDYVEAHGTGTSLGDPIEAHALAAVLGAGRDPSHPLVIGSVKTNLGHLEAAAGVAGLIKVVLSLQKQHIPPHLHFQTMNPHIDWKGVPVEIPVNGRDWKPGAKPRLAGVSSFGFSGTNVHLIVEEAPAPQERKRSARGRGVHVLALSARTQAALSTLAEQYASHLQDSDVEMGDICYTASAGRAHFAERAVYLAATQEELYTKLREGGCLRGCAPSRDSLRIAFLFSGQGAQYAGMGSELYETELVFRNAMDRCAALLEGELKPSLLDVLYGDAAYLLDDTRYTQPALFAVQYALAELWRSWGIEPSAVLGHSVGEYAAACVAGFCSLEDAIRLIAARGRLMGDLPKGEGGMAAILASQGQVEAAIVAVGSSVSIAAINGPENIVISGRAAEVNQVAADFAVAGVRVEYLRVSQAFHSPLMAPIEQEFARRATQIEFRAPRISLISSVTGRPAKAAELQDGNYWRRQVRQPVRFREAMETLASQRYDIFIEIGPGSTLLGMGRACISGAQHSWVPSIRRAKRDNQQIAESIAALYVRGVEVDWNGYEEGRGRRRVPLPTYPFERQRYWIDDLVPARGSVRAPGAHPLLGNKISVAADPSTTLWQSEISLRSHPWIADHRVHGLAIVPMTAYLEMMSAALGGAVGGVVIREPLVVREDDAVEVQVVVKQNAAEVYSRDGERWKLHASGNRAACETQLAPVDVASLRSTLSSSKDAETFYNDLAVRGHDFGPSFRLVRQIFTGQSEAVGEIEASPQPSSGYKMHPAVLDACVQTIAEAIDSGGHDSYLPMGAGHFEIMTTRVPEKLWAHATVHQSREVLTAHVNVLDGDGRIVARIRDLELRRMTADALVRFGSSSMPDVFFAPAWERAPSDINLADIATTVRSEAAVAIEQHGMAVYPTFREQMDRACAQAIVNALDVIGAPLRLGMCFRPADLAKRCGVLDRHAMLFARLLEILAEDGCLHQHDGLFDCIRACERRAVDWQALETRFPAFTNEVRITARCAENLGGVLSATTDELQLLFPGGSTESAERLYSESPSARAFNQLLSRAVASAIPATGKLKILEAGAGTGGTSTFVMPLLPADRTSYVFTDVSPLFAARAKERFAAFPFVSYATLDIERDPLKQGLGAGEYDIVIAANVLHATADLKATLDRVRSLLKPGALLVLLEVTRKERWIDLTFGMTEGWWRFTDRDLRPSYALIRPAQWKTVLAQCGFVDVEAIEAGDDSLNAILLAKKPVAEARLTGNWLIAGRPDLVPSIARSLEQAGARCSVAENNLRGSLALKSWSGVVFVAPAGNERAACEPVLEIAHALGDAAARLMLVTTGAQPAGTTTAIDPAQSVLWGLGRTIASECPALKVTCVDLDPAEPASYADALIREASSADGEPEVAYRSRLRYVNRVRPVRLKDSAGRVRLSVSDRGVIDHLRIEPAERRAPGAGQVEIEVEIAGIGFRDILNVLGMYPGDPGPLGAECAGRIVAIGAGVDAFTIGDQVIAIAPGAHDGYLLADVALVVRRPAALPIEDAMTLPVPYLTALYALDHLGRIRAGERVLIHSGAGGVGLAAIRVAQHVGAEVFATAGTEEKRELLRSIGIAHVMSSRSTEFAAEIARLSGGRGVDLVLNSLAGDTVAASFSCLARGGRFLEIGKSSIWSRQQVAALGKDISYHVIDWSEELRGNASLIGGLLRRIVDEAASGRFQPLPRTIFEFSDAHAAYRYMAQARHTGRILLRQHSPVKVRDDCTYLITGGLNGIGVLTAKYLVNKGARHLVLTGRRAPSLEATQRIAEFEQKGVAVKIAAVDVGERSDMEQLFRDIAASMPPLGGVVHSAGTLDDAVLSEQTWERFESAFRSKVRGTWNLHELTAGAPLDFFLLYSSIAAVLGAPGQANHAAASAFEDAVAWARRNTGLPATSINWGAWQGTGSADRPEYEQRRKRIGLQAFDSEQGAALLDRVLRANPVQIGVAQMDWKRYAEGRFVPMSLDPMIETAVSSQPVKAAAAPKTPALLDDLAAAPEASRMRVLHNYVHSLATRILGLSPGQNIDGRKPLHELGLDSLMAVEFRNGLSTAIARPLPVTLLFSYPAIDDIAAHLATDLVGTPADSPVANNGSVLDIVEELSDEEVDRLLAARMGDRA